MTFQPQGGPVQYAFGKTGYYQADVINVIAGETAVVNDSLLPTGTIAGRLLTAGGAAVPSAYVAAIPAGEGNGSFGSGYTGPDGSYTMTVAPGQYRVSFRTQSGTEQWAFGKTSYSEAAVITVVADQTATVNDTLLPTGSLSGVVRSSSGAPMADAEVTAQGSQYAYTRTDSEGRYRFAALRPDDYRVSVRLSNQVTLFAPQARSFPDAGLYKVTPDQETTVDITWLPAGNVMGRFTDNGVGVPDMTVHVTSTDGKTHAYTRTDSYGNYTIRDIFGGDYKVLFDRSYPQPRISQYAYGKVTAETADVATVTPNSTTTVNDSRLPTGSVRFTARNAVTGEAIPDFWVGLGPHSGGATDGVLTFTEVARGTHPMSANSEGYYILEGQSVTVTEGQQTEVQLSLRPMARLEVTVVDSATGQPVADACVLPVDPKQVRDSDGCERTGTDGKLSMRRSSGQASLLVLPPNGSGYGAQWVGANGGTGDQRGAAVMTLTDGQSTTAPTVRLDRAGTITGKVTSETGQPLQNASLKLITVTSGLGGDLTQVNVAADGRYTIDWLGPYDWPLQFRARGHATQWSGSSPSRFRADPVPVRSGTTTTYDYTMKTGTLIKGKVFGRDGAELNNARVNAFSPDTLDYAGEVWVNPGEPFELWVLSPSLIKLSFDNIYWYAGTSLESSGVYPVGRARTWLGLCVANETTMHYCPER